MPLFLKDRRKHPSKIKETSKVSSANNQYAQRPQQAVVNIPQSPPPPYPQQPFHYASPPPLPPGQWPSQPSSYPQNYYTPPPPNYPFPIQIPPRPYTAQLDRQASPWKSCSNLAAAVTNPVATVNQHFPKAGNYISRGVGLADLISNKLNTVINEMDDDAFQGDDKALIITYQQPTSAQVDGNETRLRGGGPVVKGSASRGANQAITSAITSTNYFSKANLYANSRLPPNLPPFHVYLPTYPLMCLAAQYSARVYTKPRGKEKDTHVSANWKAGTKAMVIKSVPVDDMNAIVFAVRGSATFMDWATNLNSQPVSPRGFLDDSKNKVHAGFLEVARKMVKPVAARLRTMLEEDPGRASASLLITGHSAGGAVASLLYCHMLGQKNHSELTNLTGCFKRIHCITFGAPPVSLYPLSKPSNRERQLRKSLFFSVCNEGDPVPRADRAYVKSLVELYASPAPKPASRPLPAPSRNNYPFPSRFDMSLGALAGKTSKSTFNLARPGTSHSRPTNPEIRPYSNIIWSVPPSSLANAGRLVILRVPYGRDGQPNEEDVRAYTANDLKGVVFGDPLMHQMKLYARRIEVIATKAVTGRLLA